MNTKITEMYTKFYFFFCTQNKNFIFFSPPDESVRASRPKSSTYHCEGKLGKVPIAPNVATFSQIRVTGDYRFLVNNQNFPKKIF